MIGFRQCDPRFPDLWDGSSQPAGRWHAEGDGPAHYFADTPDGAWAELLRHEEITDPADLATIRREMWVVDLGDAPFRRVRLNGTVLTGGPDSYPACQKEARRLRTSGVTRLLAPSAALKPGGARGYLVEDGMHAAPPRDGTVMVLFGAPAGLVGWIAADEGRPPATLLDRVHHYTSS